MKQTTQTNSKSEIKTIDCTPTWRGSLSLLLTLLTDATPKGQKTAREELLRMAQAADEYNSISEDYNILVNLLGKSSEYLDDYLRKITDQDDGDFYKKKSDLEAMVKILRKVKAK